MDVKKAVILAGGQGLRLRPLTLNTPKCLVEVHGKSLIEHLLDQYKKYGITKIYLAVGYLGDKMIDYFGDGSKFGVKITYFHEKEPLGTAGCLRFFKEYLDEPFFMQNGDNLIECDLEKMYKFHKKNKATGTIALWSVEDPSAYGVAELKGDKIVRFVEKPKKEEAPSHLINSGLYLLEPSVVDYVNPGFSMMEKDVFPKLASEGKLYGFKYKGQWFDTGTLERLEEVRKKWKDIK